MFNLSEAKIAVIGLGYVGLPLAVEFSKKYQVLGFDVNENRIDELISGKDSTLEVPPEELLDANDLQFSAKKNDLKNCNVYIVTVPTPIDKSMQPDLTPLIKASELVGGVINKHDVVIYESTVYPGATEEDCIPVVERVSGLKFNKGFYAGYSPERINPGDREHRVTNILKVTSGSTSEVADFVDALYASIIVAGTFKATSIKVAEAAKVIENTQRDLNIALMNELAIIFDKMEIDTLDVIEAAATKWNFHHYKPGLVGGHCIGVDPYYLTHKAQSFGYYPDVILAGRRVNAGIGEYVADKLIRTLIKRDLKVFNAKVLLLGFSFKENCPDVRNTRVIDVYRHLSSLGIDVKVYDPFVDPKDVMRQYGVEIHSKPLCSTFDVITLCVSHNQFLSDQDKFLKMLTPNGFLFDLKGFFEKSERLVRF